jgi:NAD-dependent dihydropyrimidine dehydrogenase PreA subunit
MSQQSAILNFPKALIGRPVFTHIIRNFAVDVNILRASITPEEDGRAFVFFDGEDPQIEQALDYLRTNGVDIILPTQKIIRDQEKCTDCTACVGQCMSEALTVDPVTFRIAYHLDNCIACKLCIPACSYGALESIDDHLVTLGDDDDH